MCGRLHYLGWFKYTVWCFTQWQHYLRAHFSEYIPLLNTAWLFTSQSYSPDPCTYHISLNPMTFKHTYSSTWDTLPIHLHLVTNCSGRIINLENLFWSPWFSEIPTNLHAHQVPLIYGISTFKWSFGKCLYLLLDCELLGTGTKYVFAHQRIHST